MGIQVASVVLGIVHEYIYIYTCNLHVYSLKGDWVNAAHFSDLLCRESDWSKVGPVH